MREYSRYDRAKGQWQQRRCNITCFTSAGFALLALLLANISAEARPQDDVLSAAFKCAAIADLRTWLDCYYGSAQAQRAALGMAPVPPAQASLVASPPSGSPPPQDTVLRDDVLRSALDCNRTAQGRKWLDCYYDAAEPARVRLGLRTPIRSAASKEVITSSNFGLQPKQEKTPATISARMTAYAFDQAHLFTVTLDNGEVWQQIAGDDRVADWTKRASAYTVVISRGMFGSYNFRVLTRPGLYKVHRLR